MGAASGGLRAATSNSSVFIFSESIAAPMFQKKDD
jgi:hypothetical protein